MRSIAMLGSEEQKQRWLPPMARLETLGAFALTEPDHGSDSIALETTARRDGDHWVLDGHKKWIGNGSIADVVVVWARDVADGQVKGFLVEKGTPGYAARRDRGQGLAARRVAGRDRPGGPAGAGGEPAARREVVPRHRLRARRHPRVVRVGRARARRRGLRRRAHLRQAPHAVRQAARQLPADPEPPGQDARQGHRDAAVLPPHRRPAGRGRARPHAGGPGQDAQHRAWPARCSPKPATCWAATGSCSTST